MRKSLLLHSAVLLLAAVSPATAFAQFQPPTDEELKMTADPKAPGADAVYLNIEETADDMRGYHSYYARIKVLTEKGKELATVEVPYLKDSSKVASIRGRTIHSDGTVVPLKGGVSSLLIVKSGGKEFGRRVFTLPSVEVGSILEYYYEETYDGVWSPYWEIQQTYPVRKAHYSFKPFEAFMPSTSPDAGSEFEINDERGRRVRSLIWWSHLPAGTTVKTVMAGAYAVDVTDIPAIPDEEWMPPIQSVLYKVRFYYSVARDSTDYWISESNLWSKDVEKFAEPSKAIKDAVNGLVAPGDSDMDKAKKLYAAVQALDNTDYSREKSETEMKQLKLKVAKHAEDTWAQKSGSSEDIAMLYLAMLRAAGLTAYAIKVVDRDKGVFDVTYQSSSQLNTTLVALTSNGKKTILDPGEKTCQFGMLNWRHAFTRGLGQSEQGAGVASTPEQNYRDNLVTRKGTLTLDAHGGVTGDIQIVMTGQEALHWRQVALRNDETELKKQFDNDLEKVVPDGVEAHVDHFLGIDQPDQNLMAIVKVTGSLGTATAKRVLLPGLFFETRGHVPFVHEEKRLEPVDMQYPDRITDDVTYILPSELTVEGAPQDASVLWQGHAQFVLKSKTGSNQIEILNSLARAFSMAKPEEYQDLRGFYQKVDAAEQAQLVLTIAPAPAAAPAGKGN